MKRVEWPRGGLENGIGEIVRRIPDNLFSRMVGELSPKDRDEMAIPSYLHRNPVMRWMAWQRVEVIARHFRETCKAWGPEFRPVVMDFGCGTGVLFDETSQYAECVYGVDIVLEAAKLLVDEWALKKVKLLTPEQAKSDVPEVSVDIIVAAEVLEHIVPPSSTLAYFRSRLKPDGKLLVSLPTEGTLYRIGRRLAGFHGHYHYSNASSIHREIISVGFKQDRLEKIPAPGPLAIYWIIDYSLR